MHIRFEDDARIVMGLADGQDLVFDFGEPDLADAVAGLERCLAAFKA